jgi:hypothetical protein
MGGGTTRNHPGFPEHQVAGSDTPLARQLRGMYQVQPLPPIELRLFNRSGQRHRVGHSRMERRIVRRYQYSAH